jgi:death on curing protein
MPWPTSDRLPHGGDVLALHEQEVGANLLGDFGLLESAVLRPQTSIGGEDAYPDLHTKTAALFHSLARNHAFIDGNKRIAVAATALFYLLNGHDLDAEAHDLVALAVDTAEWLLTVADIAGRLKHWTAPLPFEPE